MSRCDHEQCDKGLCMIPGFRIVENGECAAQLEIKDTELRTSMARNVAAALLRAKAEGAAEEREAILGVIDGWSESMDPFEDLLRAIRARGQKKEGEK